MELVVGILIGLIALIVLVVLHELGHAIVARRNGVTVEEFGIGFPPKAWSRRLKNGIEFSINWLPLGGFVRMKGEHDAATGKGAYGAATFWQKTKILLAGVVVNWLTAAVIFTGLALVGLPKLLPNQVILPFDAAVTSAPLKIGFVQDNSPAKKAGLQAGDELVAVNGQTIAQADDFTRAMQTSAAVSIAVRRDGQQQQYQVSPEGPEGSRKAGVGLQHQQTTIRSTYSAPIVGVLTTAQFTGETIKGIGTLIGDSVTGIVQRFSPEQAVQEHGHAKLDEVSKNVAGPIGILGQLFPSVSKTGPVQVFTLIGLMSVTLAGMNILTIPALDGGRWYMIALFRLMKKPLTKEREEIIQGVSMLLLYGLVLIITINDIGKLFHG